MSSSLVVSTYNSISPREVEREEIGYYSLNDKGEFVNDKSSLTYLYKYSPLRRLDLKVGLNTYIDQKKIVPGTLENILEWATAGRKKKPEISGVEFICRRGLIKDLMMSPYDHQDSWAFVLRKFKGIHYMVQLATDKERSRIRSSFEKETCYWGFKFEQYMTTDKKGGTPTTSEPVNNYKHLHLIFKSRIANHCTMVSGEVDCLSEDGKEYIELKTRKAVCNPYSLKKYKYRNWWGQNFLAGMKNMVVGLRDDDGFVSGLEHLSEDQLVSNAIEWTPGTCLGFLDKMLQFIKDVVGKDGEGDRNKTYLFEREAGSSVNYRVIDMGELEEGWKGENHSSTNMLKYNRENIINLIPVWYANLLEG